MCGKSAGVRLRSGDFLCSGGATAAASPVSTACAEAVGARSEISAHDRDFEYVDLQVLVRMKGLLESRTRSALYSDGGDRSATQCLSRSMNVYVCGY